MKQTRTKTYMPDTRICAFILREPPETVLRRPAQTGLRNHRIVIPAITWPELSQAAREAGPAAQQLAEAFAARLDAILPWDTTPVDATT